MKPLDNAKLYETPISTHWMDEHGIMCAISKRVERKIEYYQIVMALYRQIIDEYKVDKVCLLADANDAMPMSKDVREFLTSEMPKYVKAHAIISKNYFDVTITNTFVTLSWHGFPVKLFSEEKEAKDWLKTFL